MKKVMISALSSGSGKTTVFCGLIAALTKRGYHPAACKCGPDYIDPMFHRAVLGAYSTNLDLFLQGKEGMLRSFDRSTQKGDVLLLEGAMGYFDGEGGTDKASAFEIAKETNTPVILVVRPMGNSITLAAMIRGVMDFRSPCLIRGIILNGCKESMYNHLKPVLERECGVKVIGYLPQIPDAMIPSRHLGLVTAGEITELQEKIEHVAAHLEQTCDLDLFLELCEESKIGIPGLDPGGSGSDAAVSGLHSGKEAFAPLAGETDLTTAKDKRQGSCRIAVARDEAFCFYYEDNLRRLEQAGASLSFFSPLHDPDLPVADGIYLGGGYPELYLPELEDNHSMRKAICEQIRLGMPVIAECGGFLYLQKWVEGHEMVGLLPGEAHNTGHLVRFGYLTLAPKHSSMLFDEGEEIPAHEFHYYDCTENGEDLLAKKTSDKIWECGFCTDRMYAGFPHLNFEGKTDLAGRFVKKAMIYRMEKEQRHERDTK